MQEIVIEALRPINLPLTALLGAIVCYWLLVAMGALGIDFGADADAGDAGAHAAAHGDDAGSHADAGWFSHVLGFINIGEVPVTIVVSILTLNAWLISMITNHYWTPDSSAMGLLALLPNLLMSALATRFLTLPFKPLIRALNRDGDEHVPIVGRTCLITTSEATAEFGQAEIQTKGAPLLINVRVQTSEPLPRGTTALIVKQDPSHTFYFVVPVSSDQIN